jgi:hypothetical protein
MSIIDQKSSPKSPPAPISTSSSSTGFSSFLGASAFFSGWEEVVAGLADWGALLPTLKDPTYFIPEAITSDKFFPLRDETTLFNFSLSISTPTDYKTFFTSSAPKYHLFLLGEAFPERAHKQ